MSPGFCLVFVFVAFFITIIIIIIVIIVINIRQRQAVVVDGSIIAWRDYEDLVSSQF